MKTETLADEILSLSLLYEQEGVRLLRARADHSVERESQAKLNFAQAFDTLRSLPVAPSARARDQDGVSREFEILFRIAASSILGSVGSSGRQEAIRARSLKPSAPGDAPLRAILLATLPSRDREGVDLGAVTPRGTPHDIFSHWHAAAATCLDDEIATDRGILQLQTQHRRVTEALANHPRPDLLSHLSDLVLLVSSAVVESRKSSSRSVQPRTSESLSRPSRRA